MPKLTPPTPNPVTPIINIAMVIRVTTIYSFHPIKYELTEKIKLAVFLARFCRIFTSTWGRKRTKLQTKQNTDAAKYQFY